MKSLDKLSEQDINNMFEEYKSGVGFKEIYEKYQIPHTTFNRLRNKLGIKPQKSYYVHYNEEMQERFDDVFSDSINMNYSVNSNNYDQNLRCNINQHYFDAINTADKAYILGLLYSDGYMSKKQHSCILALQERDKSILEKINKALDNNSKMSFIPYNKKNPNHQNQYSISLNGKQIYESLLIHGCHPAKSHDLEFPTNLPLDLYKDFMRGMIDGDGSIKNKGSQIKVSLTSTPMFCNTAKLFIETVLKINCYIVENKRSEFNVDLYISGRRQVEIFLNWIYDNDNANLYIDRKHDTYLSIIGNTNNSLSA